MRDTESGPRGRQRERDGDDEREGEKRPRRRRRIALYIHRGHDLFIREGERWKRRERWRE